MLPLSRFVADTRVTTSPIERVNLLPDGTAALLFRLSPDGHADLHALGPRTHALYKRATPFVVVLKVIFRPGAGYPFFGIPLMELTDRIVPLRDLWGARADDLLDQLVHFNTNAQRVGAVQRALVETLREPDVFEPAAATVVREALARLSTQRVTVREVARQLRVSERNLRRAFSAVVGLSPRRYARIVRFQQAVLRASRGSPHWSEVAAASGYFDQAHLCADFRDLARASPTAFIRNAAVEDLRCTCQPPGLLSLERSSS